MGKSLPNSGSDNVLKREMTRRQFLQGLGLAIGGLVVGGVVGGCDGSAKSSDETGGAVEQRVEQQMQSTKNATGGVLLDEASRAEKEKNEKEQKVMEAKMEKSRELVAQLLGIYNEILHRIEAAEADSENGLEEGRPYAESMARWLPPALTKDFDRAKKALTNLLAHFGEPEDWMSGSSSWSRSTLMEAQKLACLLSAMAHDAVGGVESWVLHDEHLRKGDTGSLGDGADNYFGDDPGAAEYVIGAQKGRVYEDLLSAVSRIKKWNSAVGVESPRIESLKRKQKLQHDLEEKIRPVKGVEHPQRQLWDHEKAQRARREIDLRVADARIDEMSVEALQQDITKQERDLRWLRDSNIPRKKKSLREEFPDTYEAQFDRIFIGAQAEIARDEKRVVAKGKWIAHCKEKLEAKKAKAAAKKHK